MSKRAPTLVIIISVSVRCPSMMTAHLSIQTSLNGWPVCPVYGQLQMGQRSLVTAKLVGCKKESLANRKFYVWYYLSLSEVSKPSSPFKLLSMVGLYLPTWWSAGNDPEELKLLLNWWEWARGALSLLSWWEWWLHNRKKHTQFYVSNKTYWCFHKKCLWNA